MQYEIGQRIDIYKILTDGGFSLPIVEIGTFRPVVKYSHLGNPFLFINSNDIRDAVLMIQPPECRKVGTMIITKLK